MIEAREFPVGSKPGWELDQPELDQENALPLKSASESLVVLHSLKQSRSNWMSTTFPKFSSKSRGGKISDTIPPPHTMRSLGKFDFHVGPHIFPGTSVYEAHYLQSAPVSQLPRPGPNQPSTSTWHTAPYRPSTYTPYTPYGASTTPSAGAYTQRAFTPLVSVASDTPITPALITRVNDAAATDPILANFLQLAASGRATSDQLKTLALLIQSLAYTPSSTAALGGVSASEALSVLNQLSVQTPSSTPSTSTPATPPATLAPHTAHEHPTPAQSTNTAGIPTPKEFDLVLEFPERPYDRWLFPRVPVVCERDPSLGDIEAVLLVVALPLPKQKQGAPAESATPESSDPPQEVVQFRITKVNQAFWDSLLNWAGGSAKVEANRSVLEKIANPERVYLQHQIPEGDLLTKLQAAALPYSMKSIKPPHGDRGSTKRRTAPRRTGSNVESQGAGNAPKRKRASQPKASAISKKIACVSCGQADVPLMMGGRFCRPCMDAGKASNEATMGTQDVGIAAQPSQPSSQPLSATVANEQIAGLTVPPLVSSSPLCTNSPLIQSTTDPVTVHITSPQPPAVNS
ncbi:hypothetical protein EDB92DRAFT_1411174 [Lactarius akahatsu]|uniref:Uncharacterized protein n=1 Tax=Lactarius akahatsu TaxID=416441 RepID=A0AAD4LM25_9AGAM|nr:hypothetical protein EDB92DRAFT_1411174 [Lactarius akahatsu]